MTLFVYLNGVEQAVSSVRMNADGRQGIGGLPSAADGTGAQGSIVFDDPSGALSVTGWQIVKVAETACTSAPVLFYGTVADRTYRRGPYRLGAGREIDTTINDHNGFLSLRLLGGNGPSRPQETDIARLAWLLSDASLSGLVYDLGFVNGTGLTFDAANLQGLYPADVLNDLASHYGQIFFTYWDQSAQKVGLFFDFPTATTFTSTLSISNVLSDVNDTTVFAPYIDGELIADPSEVYSRVRFVYTGGVVWRSDATTAATFFPEPLRYRSLQVENDRIGKLTTATTFADRVLAADATEREVVTFTVRLPSTKVGLIQAGMRIHLRFTHLPGFETGAYSRIERLNVIPTDADQTHYDIRCECSTHGLTTAVGTGSGTTDPFPFVPPTTGSFVQQANGNTDIALTDPVTAGNTLVASVSARGGLAALTTTMTTTFGYTLDVIASMPVSSYQSAIYSKVADGTEGTTLHFGSSSISGTWYELPGTWTLDQTNTGTGDNATAGAPATTGSISVPAGSIVVTGSAYAQGGAIDTFGGDLSTTPGAGWTEDYDARIPGGTPVIWTAHRFPSTASTVSGSSTNAQGTPDQAGPDTTNWCAVIASYVSSSLVAQDPPASGKPWGPVLPNETPNGSTTSFTMTSGYTWSEGSLRVFVDRLDQTAAVTAQDGSAGTFTLGFAPKTGELVEVYGSAL